MSEREFVDLVKQHRGIIYECFTTYCRDLNRADITQEIILEAWKSITKFKKSCKFNTWFYTIARNVCISALRKKQKEPEIIFFESCNETIAEISNTREMLKQLREATRYYIIINSIDEPYRSLFEAYLHGVTFDELEQQTGISANALRVRVHRIKKELHSRYNKK